MSVDSMDSSDCDHTEFLSSVRTNPFFKYLAARRADSNTRVKLIRFNVGKDNAQILQKKKK